MSSMENGIKARKTARRKFQFTLVKGMKRSETGITGVGNQKA